MSPNPTPSQELIDKFINELKSLGNSAGNKRLQDTLNLSEKDYTWIKDYLITTGTIATGRGRGGSVRLVVEIGVAVGDTVFRNSFIVEQESQPEPEPTTEVEVQPDEASLTDETLTITVDTIKSKYQRLKDDIKSFKEGMKVVRPMIEDLSEEYAWRHLRTYMITRTDDRNVYVVPHPNRKREPELQALPKGFYVKN